MAEREQCFDNWEQWRGHAHRWLTLHPEYVGQEHTKNGWEWYRAVCFDTAGNICKDGGDFQTARDNNLFPVRWLWPDQIVALALKHPELEFGDNVYPYNAT